MAFDRRGQRHDRVRARVEAAQLSLILRSKLNLNGVIKDGYQVARGSSRLKYCLQIRYQLRTPCSPLCFSGLYQSLWLSVRIRHRPTFNPENAEFDTRVADASGMRM